MSHHSNQTPHPPPGATECAAYCFLHPDGPGHSLSGAQKELKAQVDKWIGSIAMASRVVTIALALLAAAVAIGIAAVPALVKSAASAAVSAEFDRRIGTLDRTAQKAHNSALMGTAQAAEAQRASGP